MMYIATTEQFLKSKNFGFFSELTPHAKGDKQYWVLSAIYRMCRINDWPVETAARLLHERAKYTEAYAKQIADIWFNRSASSRACGISEIQTLSERD